jgi:hypothetical protein
MKIAHVATAAIFMSTCVVSAEPRGSRFDGTWVRSWSSTTPKGLHTEGRGTLTINTRGKTTEISDITLSMRVPDPPTPIHLVQSCYAIATTVHNSLLTIEWSPLKLVSPRKEDIPPGLHLWTGSNTWTYRLRGDKLVTVENKPLVYGRAKQPE